MKVKEGYTLRNKKSLIALIVALTVLLLLACLYLSLRQNYNNLKDQTKAEIISHLNSSISFAKEIDLDKITTGDKTSVLNITHMYEDISDLDAILTTTYYGKITLIDPLIMYDYKRVIRKYVDKSIQGQLSTEDINNINLITNDIEQIYEYVGQNKNLSSEKFIKELEPKLKINQIK